MKQLMYQVWQETHGQWEWVIFTPKYAVMRSRHAFKTRVEAMTDVERHCGIIR